MINSGGYGGDGRGGGWCPHEQRQEPSTDPVSWPQLQSSGGYGGLVSDWRGRGDAGRGNTHGFTGDRKASSSSAPSDLLPAVGAVDLASSLATSVRERPSEPDSVSALSEELAEKVQITPAKTLHPASSKAATHLVRQGFGQAGKKIAGPYETIQVPDVVPRDQLSKYVTKNFSEGTWARVESGIYKGDLPQVVAVSDSRRNAQIKLIPSSDVNALTQKYGGEASVQKGRTPAPRLTSSSKLAGFRPLIQVRPDRDSGDPDWIPEIHGEEKKKKILLTGKGNSKLRTEDSSIVWLHDKTSTWASAGDQRGSSNIPRDKTPAVVSQSQSAWGKSGAVDKDGNPKRTFAQILALNPNPSRPPRRPRKNEDTHAHVFIDLQTVCFIQNVDLGNLKKDLTDIVNSEIQKKWKKGEEPYRVVDMTAYMLKEEGNAELVKALKRVGVKVKNEFQERKMHCQQHPQPERIGPKIPLLEMIFGQDILDRCTRIQHGDFHSAILVICNDMVFRGSFFHNTLKLATDRVFTKMPPYMRPIPMRKPIPSRR